MTDPNDAMDFLMTSGGGGAPVAKFPTIGTVHKGRVLAMRKKQQTAYGTTTPLYWESGEPRWELEITLQTDERDNDVEEDDGQRRIFAKGEMAYAIKDAVIESGWRGSSLVGGNLAIKYHANGEPPKPGFNPPHLFRAKYEAPAAVDDLTGDYGDDGTEPF